MSPIIKNWLPAAIWASLILLASSDMFSAAHTRGIIEGFFNWLFPSWTAHSIDKAHLVVRKCAHFFEYAVLAVFVMRGFTSGAKAPVETALNGTGEPAPRPNPDSPRPNADPSTSRRSAAQNAAPLEMTSAGNRRSLRMTMFAVVLLCAMIAAIDEVHQHFVPSRTSSPYDVMLDTAGSAVAMLLFTWRKASHHAERSTT